MEGHVVWGIAAAAFAIAAGLNLGIYVLLLVRRRGNVESILASNSRQRILMRLQSLASPFRPLSARAMRLKPIGDLAEKVSRLLESERMTIQPDVLVACVIALAVTIGAVAGLITWSPVCAVAVGALLVVAVYSYAHHMIEKREVAMREEVPEALRSMATCFRSGLSLPQTLAQTASECRKPLDQVFSIAERRLRLGATSAEALSVMRDNPAIPELAFVAVALDVQHQSGGSIAPVLESARDSIDSELELMRSLRVQTAQAKLSATIVTLMPFVLVALFSLLSPGFMMPFFESFAGMALLGLAILMQFTGVMIVRHMLKIDGA